MSFYITEFTTSQSEYIRRVAEKIPLSTMAATTTASSDIEVHIIKWEDQKFISVVDGSAYEDYIGVNHCFDINGCLILYETYNRSGELIGHEMNNFVYVPGLDYLNYCAYTNKKGDKTTIEFYDIQSYTMRKITKTDALGDYKRWKQGDVEEFSNSEDEEDEKDEEDD